MGIADLILGKTLNTHGWQHGLWNSVRWWLVRSFHDPPCTITAHGRTLRLPLSHELPAYLKLLPLYDSLPRRLGAFLRTKYGPLKCIDIGANVGDTIAALDPGENDRFLALEPDPKFNRYLRENWDAANVTSLDLICSSRTGAGRFRMVEQYGTASFYGGTGTERETITIDDLISRNPSFAGPHLIKIDTDGHDFAVLSGATQSLRAQPAVLFESDVFGNTRYVEDCLDSLALFRGAGYQSMLVYEKFGYPLGRHELQDLTHFKDLLVYQLAVKYMFYDILLMPEPDLLAFEAAERSFFLDALPDQGLRATAARAFRA